MDILNLNPIPGVLATVVGYIAVVYPVLIVVRLCMRAGLALAQSV